MSANKSSHTASATVAMALIVGCAAFGNIGSCGHSHMGQCRQRLERGIELGWHPARPA